MSHHDLPDAARDRLHRSGHRMTPQRQMVWDVLRRSRRHLSAEEICAEIHETLPSFNLTSVYRTLSVLESLQLAKQTVRADGRNYWEVPHGPEHHHLVCRVCGTITHHDDPLLADVKRHLVLRHDFQPEALDLIVTGVCGRCAGGTKREPRPRLPRKTTGASAQDAPSVT